MTVTLNLAPETERRLKERAARSGQTLEAYLQHVLEREVQASTSEVGAGPETRPLKEILAPIHAEFRQSGMTEGELDALIEECRDEVWKERQDPKGP